ncbi:hypothetical protein BDQ12DRAFT_665602 [Crucibulum laeve]|uniref:Uncharacterized protein n=1 Tax=Crucibulum laeve TaxID=68775 RepID=A0A5C3M2B1_9AGAR|nr:hypothetical protein BDQ12DRAFT_665602 [Crucibulum laeve]
MTKKYSLSVRELLKTLGEWRLESIGTSFLLLSAYHVLLLKDSGCLHQYGMVYGTAGTRNRIRYGTVGSPNPPFLYDLLEKLNSQVKVKVKLSQHDDCDDHRPKADVEEPYMAMEWLIAPC